MLTQDTAYRLLAAGMWQNLPHTQLTPWGFEVRLGTEVLRESIELPFGAKSHIGDVATVSATYQRHKVPAGCIVASQTLMVVDTQARVLDVFDDYLPIFVVAPYLPLNGMEYLGGETITTDPITNTVLLPFYNVSKRTALSMNPGTLLGYFSAVRAN